MKEYRKPEIIISVFVRENILTASGNLGTGNKVTGETEITNLKNSGAAEMSYNSINWQTVL